MPGTPTTRFAIPTLAGTDLVRDIDTNVNAGLSAIDSKMAGFASGSSLPGTATDGLLFRRTTDGKVFIGNGSAWVELGQPSALLARYHTVTVATGAFASTTASGVNVIQTGGGPISAGVSTTIVGAALVPISGTDWAVSGLTPKLRLRAAMVTNATSSPRTFQFGLYPVSLAAGAASQLSVAVGSMVVSSDVSIVPGPNYSDSAAGFDFAVPNNGLYVLGVNLNGVPAANSYGNFLVRLELHYV